jgi:DNA topoisomerase I
MPRANESSAEERAVPPQAGLAGLRYLTDDAPGYRRVRCGRGFVYFDADDERVTDKEVLSRLRALAIPPAWEAVWIARDPRGHLQATGRDARGRKQYRYHERWRATRDEVKFANMIAFGEALPRLRRRVREDLGRPGLPREKVVATVVHLLDVTGLRVGNPEYVRQNESYGLTTLRSRHARVRTNGVVFSFKGKSGKEQVLGVQDRRMARIVGRCKEIPGQELFQYRDDADACRAVSSGDVNEYIRAATGADFTAKDFRTWWGTVLAAEALRSAGPARSATQAKKKVAEAVRHVAALLGNTVAVCRRFYLHPAVVEAYEDGVVIEPGRASKWLSAEERATLALLRERQQ